MKTKWLVLGVAAITLAFSSGCATTHEIGKSTKQLVRGETGATVPESSQHVAQAIDLAIGDAKLIRINATTRPSESQTETIVVARDSNDTRVQVAYVPINAASTRVVVSTGAFGDSDLRERVWDAVRIRLGMIAIAPASPSAPAATQPTAQATTQPAGTTPAASAGN